MKTPLIVIFIYVLKIFIIKYLIIYYILLGHQKIISLPYSAKKNNIITYGLIYSNNFLYKQ